MHNPGTPCASLINHSFRRARSVDSPAILYLDCNLQSLSTSKSQPIGIDLGAEDRELFVSRRRHRLQVIGDKGLEVHAAEYLLDGRPGGDGVVPAASDGLRTTLVGVLGVQ